MDFNTTLKIESWVLYALGIVIVTCRFVARRMKLGKWKYLGIEDYLMLFALVNFTGVTVSINEVAKNGSNYLPPEVANNLDEQGRKQAIYGSIMTFVLEVFTITALWTIKACLLLLYHRLTRGIASKQHLGVKIVAGYCALTYVVCLLLFVFYWCSPRTYEYWAVPVRIEQCATYYHHLIFATACNISTDILLFCIPIPIIVKTKLPMKRKIILCGILGLGVFNILASILNRYYNFSNPNEYIFLYWYVAEVGIAIWVGNLPLTWPLFRMVLGSKGDSSNPSYPYQENRYGNGSSRRKTGAKALVTAGSGHWDKFDDDNFDHTTGGVPSHDRANGSDQGSQIELVIQNNNSKSFDERAPGVAVTTGERHRHQGSGNDKIMVTTTVDVSSQ